MNDGNRLVITIHSPYLINYLTLMVKAGELKKLIETDAQKKQLEEITLLSAIINSTEFYFNRLKFVYRQRY